MSESDAALLKRRCGTRVTALAACVAANAGKKDACASFQTDLTLCRCTVVCPAQAEAFMQCTRKAATAQSLEDMPNCDAEAQKMRRCLAKYKVPK